MTMATLITDLGRFARAHRPLQTEAVRRLDAVREYIAGLRDPECAEGEAAKWAAYRFGYSPSAVRTYHRIVRFMLPSGKAGESTALAALCPRNERSIRPLNLAPYQIEGGKA